MVDNGISYSSHEDKASLLWTAYKDRLGKTEPHEMLFDLGTLLHPNPDLIVLEEPFSIEEIDEVVKDLPNNKSPGSDGFNSKFFKKC